MQGPAALRRTSGIVRRHWLSVLVRYSRLQSACLTKTDATASEMLYRVIDGSQGTTTGKHGTQPVAFTRNMTVFLPCDFCRRVRLETLTSASLHQCGKSLLPMLLCENFIERIVFVEIATSSWRCSYSISYVQSSRWHVFLQYDGYKLLSGGRWCLINVFPFFYIILVLWHLIMSRCNWWFTGAKRLPRGDRWYNGQMKSTLVVSLKLKMTGTKNKAATKIIRYCYQVLGEVDISAGLGHLR